MSYPKAIGRTEVLVSWLERIEEDISFIRGQLAELVEEYEQEHKDGQP